MELNTEGIDFEKRGGLKLTSDIPEQLPALRADGRKVKQILINLLSNAIKFTRPGGRIRVIVATDARGAVAISIADTGIGIAGDQIEIALAPFSQVDSSLNRKFEGTGLGLPLAKALVELHQGKFHIESVPGQGTTVTISFPAARSIRNAA